MDGFGPFHSQAFALHGLKMLAAGKEVHIRTSFAKTGTELAAHSARAHERNTHGLRSLSEGLGLTCVVTE